MRQVWMMLFVVFLCGCATGPGPATVEHVDLSRYAGTWYEIARLPQGFEAGCTAVTARYTPLPNGKIEVVNTCHEGTPQGEVREVKGTARVTNSPANSKLKVMFFWPFEGDYWVFRLDDQYTTAVVGSPDRKTLWILHRSAKMDPSAYAQLLDSLKSDGFPVQRLERTLQD